MQASYTKLKDGSWGLRVTEHAPKPGMTLTVTKKSGETKQEKVKAIVWSGNGVYLCSIEKSASSASTSPRSPYSTRPRQANRPWAPCGYPGCSRGYCDECDGEGRYGGF